MALMRSDKEDCGVRLRVDAQLEGASGRDRFQLCAEGVPSECLAQLEFATLDRLGGKVAGGFQLLVQVAGASAALLTPNHLRDSFLWNHGRVSVKVRPVPRLERSRVFEHGRWIHAAATTIQLRWRAYCKWRQWVEAEDILCAFDLAISRHGLKAWNPVALAEANVCYAGLAADPKLLRLAVVLLTSLPCQTPASQPERLAFQWAEQCTVFYVVNGAVEFTQCLGEVAFDRWPSCRSVLGLLVRELLKRLSEAFPFLMEPAVLQQVEAVAAAAATAAKQRSGACLSYAAVHGSFQTGIQSAVMACVLRMASDAIRACFAGFRDDELIYRLRAMPSYRDVIAVVRRLQPSASSEQLLLLRPAGLPHVGEEEVLLLPVRRSENLGAALQASCLFFGVDYARLSVDVAEERAGAADLQPLAVETTVGRIPLEGAFLTVWVHHDCPEQDSFDRALQDIVGAVGSHFSLDRRRRVLKLELEPGPEQTPEVPETPLGLGDTVVLPEVYSGETQYFHFYDTTQRSMTTVRCPLSAVVSALRDECSLIHGDPLSQVPFGHLAQHVTRPVSLLASLRGLQRRLDHWLQGTFSSDIVEQPTKGVDTRLCSPWLTPDVFQAQVAKVARRLEEGVGRLLDAGEAEADGGKDDALAKEASVDPELLREEEEAPAQGQQEDEEQHRRRGFQDFLCCDVKTPLLDGDEAARQRRAAKAARGASASKLVKRPESVVPVVAAAAAASAPLVLFQPLTKWSLVEVQKLAANHAVLPSQWGVMLPRDGTLLSGALAGATLGGMLGPIGSLIGATSGVAVSGGARSLLLKVPAQVDLQDHSYVFPGPGKMYGVEHQKMYLMHENTLRPQIGLEGMVGAALTQASLRGVMNLKAYQNGDMSRSDLVLGGLRDCRDGAGIWALNNAVLHGLTLVEEHSVGVVHSLAALALKFPAPVMLIVMGGGWVVVQCTRYALSMLDREELRSDLVLSGSSTAAAVMANVVLLASGVPVLLHIPLTTFAARCAGAVAYEAWRRARRRALQEELRMVALDIMGLPPYFSKEQLLQRFRVLARLVHPDRNRSPDAKEMFQLFGICRDVLLRDPMASADDLAFAGLARRLRRASWILTDWVAIWGPQPGPGGTTRAPHPVRAPPYSGRSL